MSEKISEEDAQDLAPKVISGTGTWREGKGFSEKELREANLWQSKKDLPYDSRRKTSHEKNMEQLKEFGKESKAEKKELLQEKTVKELKEMAREKELSGYSKLKKDELIDLVSDYYKIEEI